MSRVFRDTNLFILFEGHGERADRVAALRRRMLDRGDQPYTSTLTLGEMLVKPLEQGDEALSRRYEAAHIQPVAEGGLHRVSSGLLLRSDVHRLFDRGYVTVTPALRFRVSRRLQADFDSGEHYYQLDGGKIRVPKQEGDRPHRELLEWHADTVFRG